MPQTLALSSTVTFDPNRLPLRETKRRNVGLCASALDEFFADPDWAQRPGERVIRRVDDEAGIEASFTFRVLDTHEV